MAKVILRACAIATAVIPAAIILWSHTAAWPQKFANFTDTYYPHGPTQEFSDFVPSTRTDVLTQYEGVTVRPITGNPVYLLFQPRRHSKFIRVVVEGKAPDDSGQVFIGYRDGVGPEDNIFDWSHNEMHFLDNGWREWECSLPLGNMTRERIDARRIVVNSLFASTSTPFLIRSVKIYYEDK